MKDNCASFLEKARQSGVKFMDVPTFSDRRRGICTAMKNSNNGANIRFCTCHIVGNILKRFTGRVPVDLKPVVYGIQAAETEEECKGLLLTLKLTHPIIVKYIEEIPVDQWAVFLETVQDVKLNGAPRTLCTQKHLAAIAAGILFLFPFLWTPG